jgi:hypothetical protein
MGRVCSSRDWLRRWMALPWASTSLHGVAKESVKALRSGDLRGTDALRHTSQW